MEPAAGITAELSTSELPVSYPTGSSAAAYPVQNVVPISGDTAQHSAVDIVSSQPQNNSSSSQTQYYSHSRRGYDPIYYMYTMSVYLCITSFLWLTTHHALLRACYPAIQKGMNYDN